jgi:DNA mismatch repair protein MutS
MSELLKQYKAIKEKYKEAIILFRVGDFYETFEKDAKTAANILGDLFLNTKAEEGKTTVFSIPHYSLDTALQKLVKAGHKVAICDGLEDPKTTKELVKRGVKDLFN